MFLYDTDNSCFLVFCDTAWVDGLVVNKLRLLSTYIDQSFSGGIEFQLKKKMIESCFFEFLIDY